MPVAEFSYTGNFLTEDAIIEGTDTTSDKITATPVLVVGVLWQLAHLPESKA